MNAFEKSLNKALGIQEEAVGKDFAALKQTILPLEHGWTEEEVINAMMPEIVKFAKIYATNRFEIDDGIQQGAIGVLNALRTDKGIANFASHAKNHIRTSIGRASATSGLIRKGEREKEFWDPHVSLQKPVRGGEEGEMEFGQTIAGGQRDITRLMANKELLAKIMDRAGLTDRERKVIELSYGLGEEEEGIATAEDVEVPETPTAAPPEHAGKKKIRGPVAQTKGKFARKTGAAGQEIRGTKEIADILGISKQAVNTTRNRALLKLMRAAYEVAPGEFEEYPAAAVESFIKFVGAVIFESYENGTINGTILG